MTYSLDYRDQVFKLKEKEQLTFQETSDRFGIPIRTLFRWIKRIEPKTQRDKPATKLDIEVLQKDLEDYPSLYQNEFGIDQSTIFYAFKAFTY